MPTVSVRYSGPTDTRGSRWVAKGAGRQVSLPYDYTLSADANALEAVKALAKVLGLPNVGQIANKGKSRRYIVS